MPPMLNFETPRIGTEKVGTEDVLTLWFPTSTVGLTMLNTETNKRKIEVLWREAVYRFQEAAWEEFRHPH